MVLMQELEEPAKIQLEKTLNEASPLADERGPSLGSRGLA